MRLLLLVMFVFSTTAMANVYENIKQKSGTSITVKTPVKAPPQVKR